MEKIPILELINYFSVSGDSKPKKNFPQKKWYNWGGGGGVGHHPKVPLFLTPPLSIWKKHTCNACNQNCAGFCLAITQGVCSIALAQLSRSRVFTCISESTPAAENIPIFNIIVGLYHVGHDVSTDLFVSRVCQAHCQIFLGTIKSND